MVNHRDSRRWGGAWCLAVHHSPRHTAKTQNGRRRTAPLAALSMNNALGYPSPNISPPASRGGRAAAELLEKVQGAAMRAGVVGASLWCMLFRPVAGSLLGAVSLCSSNKICGRRLIQVPPKVVRVLAPLAPVQPVTVFLIVARVVLPLLSPANWRSVCYWRRVVPLLCDYLTTRKIAKRKRSKAKRDALWAMQHERGAAKVYEMLEQFGGFNLKLCQILGSKADYLPEAYTRHLGKIFDRLPAASYQEIRAVLQREYKCRLEDKFLHFDESPIAAATIAQVHHAYTILGESVAVKVQRKSARSVINADIRNLKMLVEVVHFCGFSLGFDMLNLIREYNQVVPKEFDFLAEMSNLDLMNLSRMNPAPHPSVANPLYNYITYPTPVEELCTSRVLVMDFVEGKPLFQASGGPTVPNEDARVLLTALLHDYGRQIFLQGMFHTDPHPGNLVVNAHGQLVLLDWGQVKTVDTTTMIELAKLVLAMASGSRSQILEVLDECGVFIDGCDEEREVIMAYIFFDTRVDLPELQLKPSDPEAAWMLKVKLHTMPQRLFMFFRVITILRGVFASCKMSVSAAQVWKPYAVFAIGEAAPTGSKPTHHQPPLQTPAEHEEATVPRTLRLSTNSAHFNPFNTEEDDSGEDRDQATQMMEANARESIRVSMTRLRSASGAISTGLESEGWHEQAMEAQYAGITTSPEQEKAGAAPLHLSRVSSTPTFVEAERSARSSHARISGQSLTSKLQRTYSQGSATAAVGLDDEDINARPFVSAVPSSPQPPSKLESVISAARTILKAHAANDSGSESDASEVAPLQGPCFMALASGSQAGSPKGNPRSRLSQDSLTSMLQRTYSFGSAMGSDSAGASRSISQRISVSEVPTNTSRQWSNEEDVPVPQVAAGNAQPSNGLAPNLESMEEHSRTLSSGIPNDDSFRNFNSVSSLPKPLAATSVDTPPRYGVPDSVAKNLTFSEVKETPSSVGVKFATSPTPVPYSKFAAVSAPISPARVQATRDWNIPNEYRANGRSISPRLAARYIR